MRISRQSCVHEEVARYNYREGWSFGGGGGGGLVPGPAYVSIHYAIMLTYKQVWIRD